MLAPRTIIYIRKFPLCLPHVCYIFAIHETFVRKQNMKNKTDSVQTYECVLAECFNSTYNIFLLLPFHWFSSFSPPSPSLCITVGVIISKLNVLDSGPFWLDNYLENCDVAQVKFKFLINRIRAMKLSFMRWLRITIVAILKKLIYNIRFRSYRYDAKIFLAKLDRKTSENCWIKPKNPESTNSSIISMKHARFSSNFCLLTWWNWLNPKIDSKKNSTSSKNP